MKKRILSVLLTIMMLATMCWTGVSAAGTENYSAVTIDPIYSADSVAVGTSPVAITENAVSDFTADVDYTVESGESASVTFDMEDADWATVYNENYDDGATTIGISGGSGSFENTGNAIKIYDSDGSDGNYSGVATENIATVGSNFKITLTAGISHWTGAYMFIGSHLRFTFRGNGNSEATRTYLNDLKSGAATVYSTGGNIENKLVEIICLDGKIEMYQAGTLVLEYTLPDNSFKGGAIYFTCNKHAISLKDLKIENYRNGMYNVYYNDFENGETLEIVSGSGTITNETKTVNGVADNSLIILGNANNESSLITENLVDSVSEFVMSFDNTQMEHWTASNIRIGSYTNSSGAVNPRFVLAFRGNGNGNTSRVVLYDKKYNTSVSGSAGTVIEKQSVQIICKDGCFKMYQADVLVIDYTLPDGGMDAGPIFLTENYNKIGYGYISIDVPAEGIYDPETDSYYEVGLGENVTLGRRVNGVYTEIAKSDVTLTADKQYNFKVMRDAGSVTITADGKEVLNTAIDFPYTEGDVSLWNGLIGVTASGNDTIDRIAVYDSTNLNFTDEYVEIVPYEDAVKDEFTLSDEGTWDTNGLKGDSSYSITSDSEFSVSSDSRTNSWVYARDLLNNTHSDVYISFDVKTNRDSYTNDKIFFAGYTLAFSAGNIPTATNASGTSITVSDSYKYFGASYYTVELIKKGSAVSVYYYPAGAERNLLFTDNSCTETATNFGIYKFQGTLSFKNFTVYDAVPSDVKKFIALSANSLYVKTADGVGAVPFGTTVREVKANLINASTVNITRDGAVLADTDIVLSGDVIESTEIATLKWNIGTLADLNGDGVIDNADLELARTVSGAASAQTAALAGADINQDGTVDKSDITELSRMIAENDTAMTYIKRSIVGDALLLHGKNIGRQYYEENVGVNFEWTAANITIGGYMQGDVTVTINFDSGSEIDESAVDIFIDGDTKTRNFMHLSLGTHTYTIAEDLEPGYHTVQIMKNNESIMGAFYMEAIGLTGTPEKVADKDRKIEFLGDSITAGCGVLLTNDSDWYHYNYHTYASVAARALNADYYAMANSGWGFARNLKNPSTLNRIYDLATDRRDPELKYDFSWKPDLVVVNLGTNDNTVLNDQRKAVEEDDNDTTVYDYTAAEKKYKSEVVAMLERIRAYNADAKIIWTYGAMGYGMTGPDGRTTGDWIKEAVEEYNTTDGKVMFYRMPASQNGGGGHPDSIGSKYLGEEFAEVIAEYMEWEYTPEIPAVYEYGETVSSYDFEDGTTQGIIANNLSLAYNSNNRLMLQSQDNLSVLSSAFAGNKYLDTYEMTLNWDHEGATDWNRMILTLRSPNSSLTDAIYLTVLGTNLAQVNNHFNPLKYTTNNVQLIASKGGVMTELGSLQMDDILNGNNKCIDVKMGIDWLEVTIWDADAERPEKPTFAVPINDEIAPAYGDIFAQGRNSNDIYDNINIVYGVNVELPGDLDRSNELDALDLALMRQYLLNIENDIDRFATDVNLDSKINLLDLVRLKKNMVK